MSLHKPDFRKLPLRDVVESISALNTLIVQLRPIERFQRLAPWAGGRFVAARLIESKLDLPPAHLPFMEGVTKEHLERMIRDGRADALLFECERMRDAFKQVYRARPGRKQFNLAARRVREDEKDAKNPTRYIPRGGLF